MPYLHPACGGPPGQTRLHNAAPITRFHHRLKTFAGWNLRQPEPGIYLWRSPHNHYWLTTPTGTHLLPPRVGRTLRHALDAATSLTDNAQVAGAPADRTPAEPRQDACAIDQPPPNDCGCPKVSVGVHLTHRHVDVA